MRTWASLAPRASEKTINESAPTRVKAVNPLSRETWLIFSGEAGLSHLIALERETEHRNEDRGAVWCDVEIKEMA